MTNMRRGFTMIELIFVIVIIGILAAVAIPKLAGTATKARESVHEGFIGTLNRSVGPAMWADRVNATAPDLPGSVKSIGDIASYTDLPTGVENFDLSGCGIPVNAVDEIPAVMGPLPACIAAGGTADTCPSVQLSPAIPAVPSRTGYEKIADITNLEEPAAIYCLDGNGVKSPSFGFNEAGAATIVYNP